MNAPKWKRAAEHVMSSCQASTIRACPAARWRPFAAKLPSARAQGCPPKLTMQPYRWHNDNSSDRAGSHQLPLQGPIVDD